MKLRPPCKVLIDGKAPAVTLRKITRPTQRMKQAGWQGMVAFVQNGRGTGIVEYRRLTAATQLSKGHKRK